MKSKLWRIVTTCLLKEHVGLKMSITHVNLLLASIKIDQVQIKKLWESGILGQLPVSPTLFVIKSQDMPDIWLCCKA